jgi:hypothetical protein
MAKPDEGQRGATLPKIQQAPGKPVPGGALPPKIPVIPKPSGGGTSGGSGGSK